MAEYKRKAFKITQLKVSEIEDPELRSQLQNEFINVQGSRALAVEQTRDAAMAALEAQNSQNNARITEMKFLTKAGEAGGRFDAVRTEQVWFIYSKDGDIILESPFTERDMRNAMRVQRAQMQQQAEQIEGGEDLYEENNGEEGQ